MWQMRVEPGFEPRRFASRAWTLSYFIRLNQILAPLPRIHVFSPNSVTTNIPWQTAGGMNQLHEPGLC